MKGIDLHTHSTYSDGSCTPQEIIMLAGKKNLAALALTDHDTMDGAPDFLETAEAAGIEALPGVELSLEYEGIEIHLLGYFERMPDFQDERCRELNNILEFNREEKVHRHQKMVRQLNQQGISVNLEKMQADAGNAVMNRVHFARELMRQGYVRDIAEAFSVYLGEGKRCYVPRRYLSVQEGIQAVRKAGGISVLAHPWLYAISEETLGKMLMKLMKWGLRGVETYYAKFSAEQITWLETEANRLGLLATGGTDFHGVNKKNLELGTGDGSFFVPYKIYENLLGGFSKEAVKKD